MSTITAKDIVSLLEVRHSRDVFFEEVNLGSAHANCRRLDAWAMPRSWAKWTTHGYEIKVSRSDFVRDNKWHGYREHVENMWFVCPHGLIQPEELPEGVGLLWVAKTGSRLFTKRKAVRREANATETMIYLLMSRTRPHRGFASPQEEPAAYWRAWLERKEANREMGRVASQAIRKRALELEYENAELRRQNETLATVKRELQALRLDGWDPVGALRRQRQREEEVVDRALRQRLEGARRSIDLALERIAELDEASDATREIA